jgi:hypothetical protein
VLAGAVGCGSGSPPPSPEGTALEQPDITVAAIQSVTAAGLYISRSSEDSSLRPDCA